MRVIPFTATEESRPVLQCVLFRAKDGKLTLVSADGFRLAVESLDLAGEEGEALVNRDELRGVINALKRARRARVSFEKSGDSLDGTSLVIDTELIRYKWRGNDGTFPDYEKLIPDSFNTLISLDTYEAIKAVSNLKALADGKEWAVDLTAGDGRVVLTSPDDKGRAEVAADVQGEVMVRLSGRYLIEALKACGGMVEVRIKDARSPLLFTANGYKLVVMPMLTATTEKQGKGEAEAGTEAKATEARAAVKTTASEPTGQEAVAGEQVSEPQDGNGAEADETGCEVVCEGEVEGEPENESSGEDEHETARPKGKRKRGRKRELAAVA